MNAFIEIILSEASAEHDTEVFLTFMKIPAINKDLSKKFLPVVTYVIKNI